MKIIPHKTATDTITQCIDTTHADFFGNEVEACAMQTPDEAAQSSMHTLMAVAEDNPVSAAQATMNFLMSLTKTRPDLVRDVVNVLDVELLENTDAWHTFAESCSTGEK